jgi:hypothetical protein
MFTCLRQQKQTHEDTRDRFDEASRTCNLRKKTFLAFVSYYYSHQQCILSQFRQHNSYVFPIKSYTLAGFEPSSHVSEADAMTTAPCRLGSLTF